MNKLNDTFANRLHTALTIRNMKQSELSYITRIHSGKISSYINGRYKAKQDTIYNIAQALNVNPLWLMGYDIPMEVQKNNENIKNTSLINYIPVYGKIKAGIPNFAEQEIIGMLPIDLDIIPCNSKDDIFFLQVDGESMNKIAKNGSYVLIKKQNYAENGDIIVALVNGYDATLKKYKRISDKIILLSPMSTDSSFEDIIVNLEETEFLILGKKIAKFEIG